MPQSMMGKRTGAHVQNQNPVIRVRPRLVFTRRVSKPIEPISGGGLDFTRVKPGLRVFLYTTKLIRDSFNPGRTPVSLCRVNRA